MKIGKRKPPGIAGVTPIRQAGDPTEKGARAGRPTSYRPEYCGALLDYFCNADSWGLHHDDRGGAKVLPQSKIPTLQRFASNLRVTTMTLYRWGEKHPEFGEAMAIAKEAQFAFGSELIGAGVGGNGLMSFMRCVHGLVEPKQDQEDKEDGPIQRVVVEVVGANQHKGD